MFTIQIANDKDGQWVSHEPTRLHLSRWFRFMTDCKVGDGYRLAGAVRTHKDGASVLTTTWSNGTDVHQVRCALRRLVYPLRPREDLGLCIACDEALADGRFGRLCAECENDRLDEIERHAFRLEEGLYDQSWSE